ncbi:MAG: hypothetical protein KAS88_06430 [Deltaproteobacteria bacterium]|nr:hypothetical protein [Deltaproteobacteria bacterium]
MTDNILIQLLAVTLFALVVNIPFGYLRSNCKRLSFTWFLYIHAPIPLIIALRIFVGLSYKAIPLILASAVLGQFLGGRLNKKRIS